MRLSRQRHQSDSVRFPSDGRSQYVNAAWNETKLGYRDEDLGLNYISFSMWSARMSWSIAWIFSGGFSGGECYGILNALVAKDGRRIPVS